MQQPRGLRRDIQGLRGLAVAVVVLDHAVAWPSGGFLGVDVFFVLSGFVITTGLLRERDRTGRIGLLGFARRRVRRLVPASLTVIVATVVAGFLILPPGRVTSLVTDAVASLFAVANWRFAATDTGYFATDASASPFQHFWSLGVEEQFYLVLPLLLLLLLGRGGPIGTARRRLAVVVIVVVAVLSLACAFVAVATAPDAAYFSTLTRAWELLLGVSVAFAAARAPRLPRLVTETAAALGVLAVLGAVLLGQSDDGVPAPLALLPTIGTAVLLLVGTRSDPVATWPLRRAPLVGLGTVSYSLYLWHWPVIVLLPLVVDVPVPVVLLVALLASIASWALIERPFRSVRFGLRSRDRAARRSWLDTNRTGFRIGGVVAVVLVNVVGLSVAVDRTAPVVVPAAALSSETDQDGADDEPVDPVVAARNAALAEALGTATWPDSPKPSVADITTPGYTETITKTGPWSSTLGCSTRAGDWDGPSCTWGAADGTRVLVVGDSTAAFSMPGWRALAEDPDAKTRVTNGTRIGCPFSTVEFPSNADSCAGHNPEVLAEIDQTHPDVLVVTNRWWDENDPDMKTVSRAQYEAGVRQMLQSVRGSVGTIVIAPALPPGPNPTDCLAGTRGPLTCVGESSTLRGQAGELRAIAKEVGGVAIDTSGMWCLAGRCPAVVGDAFTRLDTIHMAPDAAHDAAPSLLQAMRAAGALSQPESDGDHGTPTAAEDRLSTDQDARPIDAPS